MFSLGRKNNIIIEKKVFLKFRAALMNYKLNTWYLVK